MRSNVAAVVLALCATPLCADDEPLTMSHVLATSTESDWQALPQDRLLYLFLERGVVVFELAHEFAPNHIGNIEKLAAERYWDGLAIIRSQDNYVVQWGDPQAGTDGARSLGDVPAGIAPEFYRAREGLDVRPIDSDDAYADEVGFVSGFPVGSDGDRAWLTHCYGMLGAGRANEIDSGNGAELYVVTGHAPRHLDRNVTLLGRVVSGIEHLSSLPRGTGPLGFYESEDEYVPIERIRLGSQLDVSEQVQLERMRTDTTAFDRLVTSRKHRVETWFADPAGRIGLCNVPLPVREID